MGERQSLERELSQLQSKYTIASQAITQYEGQLNEREEDKNQALSEGRRLRKLLQYSEQELAKLTDEHKQLEGSYTASQKELNLSRLQVQGLKEEAEVIQRVSDGFKQKVTDLEGRLSVAMSGFASKEEDLTNALEIIQNLQDECFDLKASLESSKSEMKDFFNQVASLEAKLEEVKGQRSGLINTVQSLEESFENKRKNNQSLRQEVAAVKVTKRQREEELGEMVKAYQELRSLHHQFIAVLEGNLEPELASEFESDTHTEFEYVTEAKSNANPSTLLSSLVSGSLESGIASPDITISSPLPPPPLSSSPATRSPDTLASFITKLQSNLLSLRKTNKSIEGELAESKARIATLSKQKDGAEKQTQKMITINREIEASLQAALKTNSELQTTIDLQTNEIKELSLKIDEVCNLQRRTTEELELCRVKNQAAVVQLSKLTDQQVMQEMEKRELQSELKKAKLTHVLQENELMRLTKEKDKWQMLEMERETKLHRFEEEKHGMELTNVKVRTEMKDIETRLFEAIDAKEEIMAAYRGQQERGRELEKEKKSLIANASKNEEKLKKQIEELTKIREELEARTQALGGEVINLKKDLCQVKSAHGDSQGKMASLLSKVEELKSQKSSCKEKVEEEKGLRDALTRQLNVLKAKLEREIKSNTTAKETVNDLQKEVERKKREMSGLRDELSKAKREINSLLTQQTELKNTLSASCQLNTDLAARIEENEIKHQKE